MTTNPLDPHARNTADPTGNLLSVKAMMSNVSAPKPIVTLQAALEQLNQSLGTQLEVNFLLKLVTVDDFITNLLRELKREDLLDNKDTVSNSLKQAMLITSDKKEMAIGIINETDFMQRAVTALRSLIDAKGLGG